MGEKTYYQYEWTRRVDTHDRQRLHRPTAALPPSLQLNRPAALPPTPSSLLSLLPFRSRVLQRMPMQRQQMLQQGAAYAAAIVAICIGTWAT